MKLATFQVGKELHLGVIKGDWVVDIGCVIDIIANRVISLGRRPGLKKLARTVLAAGSAPRDMLELLACGETWCRALDELLSGIEDVLLILARNFRGLLTPLGKARLRAPISRPGKIICVGRNYAEHARERGAEPPTSPVFFAKSHNTICGPGDPIVLPPNSTQVDYEAELAVVISKGAKRIPEEKAYEHVAGYMILHDVSARDMQAQDKQWFRGKSCDTFAPTGPWIVTRDEIPDPHNLCISLTLNGEVMQDADTRKMIFTIPYLISYLSQSLSWEPGDVLSTGTPEGVGAQRTPPVFLKPGDTVSITVERIGTLVNTVVRP